ncbi:MAG: DUF1559 domain-containing protein [Novipirellula sp. JB048]
MSHLPPSRAHRTVNRLHGFTLVELLVVIAIIGVLVGLLLPAVQAAREAARRMQCSNHLKQMGIAMHNYHDTFGSFPLGSRAHPFKHSISYGTNWRASLLPFMEQTTVYEKLNFETGGFSGRTLDGGNEVLRDLVVPVYKCPSSVTGPFEPDRGGDTLNPRNSMMHEYVGIAGSYPDPGGRTSVCKVGLRGALCNTGLLIPNDKKAFRNATDGTSNTILIAEQSGLVQKMPIRANYNGGWCGVYGQETVQAVSTSVSYHHTGLSVIRWAINSSTYVVGSSDYPYMTNTVINSMHPGGIQVLLADGSVRFLTDSLEMETLRRLGAADDGEVLNEF